VRRWILTAHTKETLRILLLPSNGCTPRQYSAGVDLLPWIADERRLAANLIDTLSPQQLAAPSLCSAWTVHEVAAHLLMPLVTPLPRVILMTMLNGFDFNKANLKLASTVARRSAAEIAEGLRAGADYPFKPPGMGFEAPLTDLLVHQQDIRRPLGLPYHLVPDRLCVCLDFTAGLMANRLASGLRFEANDLDWVAGAGPVVRGPAEALLMILNGRAVALADVEGEGVELIRSRLIK
jgi:uncharacterized protein (TIGR03083 family)